MKKILTGFFSVGGDVPLFFDCFMAIINTSFYTFVSFLSFYKLTNRVHRYKFVSNLWRGEKQNKNNTEKIKLNL